MKYLLCIAIGAAAAAGVYLYFNRKKDNENVSATKNGADNMLDDDNKEVTNSFVSVSDASLKLNEDKADVVEEIKSRHESAATEMREALNNIVSESNDIRTENTDELNEMLSDLDKLMD